MTSDDVAALSAAIMAWIAWDDPDAKWPGRDDSRVAERLGREVAERLMPRVREIEEEFYTSPARHVAADAPEMHRMAIADFRAKNIELSEEAVRALAWAYAWDFR